MLGRSKKNHTAQSRWFKLQIKFITSGKENTWSTKREEMALEKVPL